MEIDTIIKELQGIGIKLNTNNNKLECYLFGSAINTNYPNDIDILLLYSDITQLTNFKSKIKSLEKKYPLHLSYFTYYEEAELNFIINQNAKKIF